MPRHWDRAIASWQTQQNQKHGTRAEKEGKIRYIAHGEKREMTENR